MHLTNYSVNKKSKNFIKNNGDDIDNSSKWEFQQLKNKFESMNLDWDKLLYEKIYDVIIKTCISVEPLMLASVNRTKEH